MLGTTLTEGLLVVFLGESALRCRGDFNEQLYRMHQQDKTPHVCVSRVPRRPAMLRSICCIGGRMMVLQVGLEFLCCSRVESGYLKWKLIRHKNLG